LYKVEDVVSAEFVTENKELVTKYR
jgi:hypothetical protein